MFKKLKLNMASTLILSAFLILSLWACHAVFVNNNVTVYDENGPIETLQAGLLAMASFVYLMAAFYGKRPDRLVLLFCSLLCYGFFLRELDVEDFNLPDIVIFIGAGIGRNVSLLLALLVICVYAGLSGFSRHYKAGIQFARSRGGALLVAGGVFMLLGDVFEKTSALEHYVLFEEIAELLGYTLILLSALATRPVLKRMSVRSRANGALRAGEA
ncbi:hypothetical protein [Pseudomonas sp. B392_1p]|uniref:hypothetical protein n=1 Tax=Pseudomonas sp. B392_1p TaxID=3457507 RepID=UPI003FD67BD3